MFAMTQIHELAAYVHEITRPIGGDVPADAPSVVDCHFIRVLVDERLDAQRLRSLIEESERGEFTDIPIDRLRQGPCYIEIGAWIGDQALAFQLMAAGQVAGFWQVVTPALFGITGPRADELAGVGGVMVTGYDPTAAAPVDVMA